jgi:thiosulfate/3-mercaptopyruvate sulfurtransferase
MTVPTPLVSPEWLSENLDNPSLRVLDASFVMQFDPETGNVTAESGRPGWEQGHIPGSGHADLLELSDPDSPLGLTLPSPEHFAEGMSRLGVGPATHVVAYDIGIGMFATRLWWMLRVFGYDAVSVLDAGWRAWCEGGHPVSTDEPEHPGARFEPIFRPELLANGEEVEAFVADGGACLINALSPELFKGEGSVAYSKPGRIPSSVNVPSYSLVDPATGRYLPPEDLQKHFSSIGALEGGKPVVTYCGGGVAATMAAFGLALVGREDVAVYDGSLADWTADPARPVETG